MVLGIKEYVKNLDDEKLKFLQIRLGQGFSGDFINVLLVLQENEIVDHWLKSVDSYEQFFERIDLMEHELSLETNRRNLE